MKKENFDKQLGAWLKEKRTEKNLSLQAVADRIGVTRSAVHCWETGKRQLYAQTLLDLCDVLGANLDEFIAKEDN